MAINPATDLFLVNSGDATKKITGAALMATIADDDLMIVNRTNTSFRVTGADVKASLGGGGGKPIYPEVDEITASPSFQSGTGTEADPFVLKTIDVRPGGAIGVSVEEITIDVAGATEGDLVKWTDNSAGAGDRFAQPTGVVGADGAWVGRLVYQDNPATLTDTAYTGNVQIGDAYFRWTVEQGIDAIRPINPTPAEITANPDFQGGSGTVGDPYILESQVCLPAGSNISSIEEITLAEVGATSGELVRWIDNSAIESGARFAQPESVTNAEGKWIGRLFYNDTPSTTEQSVDYVGDLQIGSIYIRWQVTQFKTVDIQPEPDDITASPDFQGGSGTVSDPYILETIEAKPSGSSALSVETVTIAAPSGLENLPVVWTELQGDGRFVQPAGITGPGGVWTGRLAYNDTPDTTVDQTYTGDLRIGTTYFRWSVEQKVVSASPPVLTNVALIESSPEEGNRFTSESFVASSQVTEGEPVAEKIFNAHVDGTLSKQVKFDEPLESSGTVTGPARVWSNDLASASGFSTTNPKTNAFDGTAGFAQTSANIYPLQWDTSAYPLNGRLVVNAACGGIYAYKADGSYVSVGTGESFVTEIDCGEVSDCTMVEWIVVTAANTVTLESITLDGEEFIDGQSIGASTALTFATGTNMEALAAGDAVNQTSNFTEPLESQGTASSPDYSTFLTCPEGFSPGTPPSTAFDGTTDEPVYSEANSSPSESPRITWDCSSYGFTDTDLIEIWMSGTTTWIEFVDTNGTVVGGPRGNSTNNAWWSPGSIPNLAAITTYNKATQPTGISSRWCSGVRVNGTILIDGQQPGVPTLTFPTGTDMSVLEVGDNVNQPSQYVDVGRLDAYNSFTPNHPDTACFDGKLDTYAEVNNTDGSTSNTLDWYPDRSVNKITNGAVVQIRTDSTAGFNSNPQQTFNPITTPFVGYEATIVTTNGEDLSFVRTSTPYGTPNRWNAIFVDGAPLIQYPAGTVGSITGTTVALSSSTGTWVNGEDVTTGDKTTTGTVGSVANTTATLSSSSGAWVNENNVIGPQKTIVEQNARLYCAFDSNGNITDLQDDPQDPPYTTQGSNPGLTFTFPATFPSGQTPDDELPEGTTFTVEVTAENTSGTSGPVSATVQPEPGGSDPALGGLTTLYNGNDTGQPIVNGIDLVSNAGLVWIKSRDDGYQHMLFDTLRGATEVLTSNTPDSSYSVSTSLTSFNTNGFTVGSTLNVNGPASQKNVAWTFGKAESYFDVIKYSGNSQYDNTAPPGQEGRALQHSLGTKVGFAIIKNITKTDTDWMCYSSSFESGGAPSQDTMRLNEPGGKAGTNYIFNGGRGPNNATEFGNLGAFDLSNETGSDYVAYLFAEDTPDVIKCGKYSGSGSSQTINVGFKPQWLLVKSSQEADWFIFDNKRGSAPLTPNENVIEGNAAFPPNAVNFVDNGFEVVGSGGVINSSSVDYIYVAIAAPPDTRSQANEEFVESQAKFLTYDNRRDINQGQEAMNRRSDLIAQADNLGLTKDQVEAAFTPAKKPRKKKS